MTDDSTPAEDYETIPGGKAGVEILQWLLAHPSGLPTRTELEYIMADTADTDLDDALTTLVERGYLRAYDPASRDAETSGSYYGFTADGVRLASNLGLLKQTPLFRAVYQKTIKPPEIRRLEQAPRPEQPEEIREALGLDY